MDTRFNTAVTGYATGSHGEHGDQLGAGVPDDGCLYDQLLPLLTPGYRQGKLAKTIDHLREVVVESERATNTILEAAESLEQLADVVDPETAEMLRIVVTRIYQASNFQDIGGQRITKGSSLLEALAGRLDDLATTVGTQAIDAWLVAGGLDAELEDELLEGPGLSQGANSQEDIDALLASFD